MIAEDETEADNEAEAMIREKSEGIKRERGLKKKQNQGPKMI